MELQQIQESLRKCSKESEDIYSKIGSAFPSLLAINKTSDSSSLDSLISLLQNISDGFAGYRADEVVFFEQYNAKNTALFTDLNDKMHALDGISERVSAIRSDSEELEIIALNAMIVSIKSGDKGRAFSCITENLKSLSARMIELSNLLIFDQKKLTAKNETLKDSFLAVIKTQKDLLEAGNSGGNSDILRIIASASLDLQNLKNTAGTITAPILDAMSGIQLQDIIRQSIDQVLLAVAEFKPVSDSPANEDKLDQATLNSELLSVSASIARDVFRNLESSIETFSSAWAKVHLILDEVESLRVKFKAGYLDERNMKDSSIPLQLERMTSSFAAYIGRISLYQRGKKTMVRESTQIVFDVKHLRVLFDSIRPVIERLQHVRINQQIEVSKNPALSTILDTVNYMSSLINQADMSVQDTRKELLRFIGEIDELILDFSSGSEIENSEIEEIKAEKTVFFDKMKSFQENLALVVVHLQVYPDSFQGLCREIDSLLSALKSISSSVSDISNEFDRHSQRSRAELDRLLSSSGLENWTIRNSHFMKIVERFTITSHKETAGRIGGFEIERATHEGVESGDVTLFF